MSLADGYVQHLPLAVSIEEYGGFEALERSLRPHLQRPPPFRMGKKEIPVPRLTGFFHRPGSDPVKYKFGQHEWDSRNIPDDALPILLPLFEKSATFALNEAHPPPEPNVALVQLYEGDGAIGWHADDEKSMSRDLEKQVWSIVSMSFGNSAKFMVRPKQSPPPGRKRVSESVVLKEGDVLVMKTGTQERYEHSIPKGGIAPELKPKSKGGGKRKRDDTGGHDDEPRYPPNALRISITFRHQTTLKK